MTTKPKLALIPSAYKASKVYSVLPADGVGDFDFSRPTTATRINKDGLIETVGSNVPRLNYPMIDGVVSGCPSLLLEPTSTNEITYSEDFTDASWGKLNSVANSNVTISPDGTTNAERLIDDNSTGTGAVRISEGIVGLTSSESYTMSIFAKADQLDWILLNANNYDGAIDGYAFFDLTNGVVGTNSNVDAANIESYGNGWYRCSISFTLGAATTSFGPQFFVAEADNNNVVDLDGTSSIFIWGAQVEQKSYATSYIPTNGGTVTRDAETCKGAGDANTFNDSEGVLFAEISALADDLTNKVISINDNSGSNVIRMGYTASINKVNFIVRATNTNIYSYSQVLGDITTINKIAISYNSSEAKVFINGILSDSGALSSLPIGLSQLDFRYGNGTRPFYGNVKQIQYFDKALTDAELISLTS